MQTGLRFWATGFTALFGALWVASPAIAAESAPKRGGPIRTPARDSQDLSPGVRAGTAFPRWHVPQVTGLFPS